MNEQLDKLLGRELFERIPFNVAVIDKDFNVVAANKHFEDYFGDWKGRRCYEVYKGSFQPCSQCVAVNTFKDGKIRVIDGVGIDRHGINRHYVAHLAPLYNEGGEVQYVIEMTTDLTETRRWQREYDLLFDRVPCYITVIDSDFRIIRANEKFRQTFGTIFKRHSHLLTKPFKIEKIDAFELLGPFRGPASEGSPCRPRYIHSTPYGTSSIGMHSED